MIHPLLRLIATQPHLLADHAEAYAELASEELGRTATFWKWRVVLNVVALVLAAVAVVLGGVALMLWAVTAPESIQSPWALFAAPLLPAAVAVWCVFESKRLAHSGLDALKEQVRADLSMLREVSVS